MGGGLNISPNTSDLGNIEHEGMGDCLDEELGKEYEEGDEGSDISDSEINQYKEAVHKLLKFRTYKIRCPNGDLRCPFCVGVEKHEYHRLLEHAIRVAEDSTESGKQRANHFAMAKYLVIDLAPEEKKKMVLCNNQMAEKLREAEENYRGLLEKLKENEVVLSNLQDIYRRSILKEQRSNEKLEDVHLELVKKDLSNNEMAEKLTKAEENYGGVVKRLESSHTALAEKNSMLEAELAQAKEDATSTVAKLGEVEKTCLQLQQNLQSIEEKLSNLEYEMHQKTLNESPTPPECIAPLPGGVSDSHITKSAIEKHQGNLEILSRCIKDNLGFKDGKPMAACVIYKCLLYWHAFESERTATFDFIIERINDALKKGDKNATLLYWLSNTSALVCPLQRNLRWNGFLTAGSQRSTGLPGSIEAPKSSFKYHGLDDNLSHMEAKYPALLFKQQLSDCVGKIFGLIRDNLKKEISPLLVQCIQEPKMHRVHRTKSFSEWNSIIRFLDLLMCRLRDNHVPSFFIRKLTTQVFSVINTQLFNSLLLRRECCTFSNGEFIKSGLAELEMWINNATEFAGTSWHELNYIRQAVGFLVRHQKRKISLEEIRQDLCPKLTVKQIYRISTMYWDHKHGAQSVSNEVLSQMRDMINKDSWNLSSSNLFLQDEDLSIPFSTEDVYTAIPATDPSDIELPEFFS